MLIQQTTTFIGPAPALLMYQGSITQAAEHGVILFYHGFTVSKEIQVKELTSLAEQGFLAIGLDLVGHGARRYPDFEARFASQNPHQGLNMSRLIRETAEEVPVILDTLISQGWLYWPKVGIGGISMGGYVTYKAITLEPRLKVAACIVASPDWQFDAAESPSQHLEKFDKVKLLSQNAAHDEHVPPHYARQFHQRLADHFPDAAHRFTYLEYPHSGHMMREEDWAVCWDKTVAWFKRHLIDME